MRTSYNSIYGPPKYHVGEFHNRKSITWDRLLVNLIVPYKIRVEGSDKPLILRALTMINPETGWFEIKKYKDKPESTISNLVDKTWLYRY